MIASLSTLVRRGAACLALALLAHGAAHAGLVSGRWDPPFGPTLPDLSWQARANFIVPDACSNQGDGVYTTTGLCAGVTVQNAWLRLFDTNLVVDPNNFFGIDPNSSVLDMANSFGTYAVYKVRIVNQQVVGFEAGWDISVSPLVSPVLMSPPFSAAANNAFGLVFTVNGPTVYCFACDNVNGYPTGFINGNPDVVADNTSLQQFLITYTDTGAPKLGTDGEGRALGLRLNGAGEVLGVAPDTTGNPVQIPEPASWALALACLGGLRVARRSRR